MGRRDRARPDHVGALTRFCSARRRFVVRPAPAYQLAGRRAVLPNDVRAIGDV
jgi:hypothetical protein